MIAAVFGALTGIAAGAFGESIGVLFVIEANTQRTWREVVAAAEKNA